MKPKLAITAAGVLTLAAVVLASQAAALKRVPKVGETTNYKMKIDLAVQGMEVNVSFDVNQTISKVGDDGTYVITEKSSNQKVLVGGSEMPGEGDSTSRTTYAPNGTVTKVESDSPMGNDTAIANLTAVIWPDKPVTVGSKWSSTIKGDAAQGTADTEYTFEILAKETVLGVETFKVSSVAKSGGATCTATSWLEISNGRTIKAIGEMKGVPIMGTPMDAKFHLEMSK